MILKKPMKINAKYKNASINKDAIKLLPEIITFLGEISAADSRAINVLDASSELTKLADKAENIKKKIGYGY